MRHVVWQLLFYLIDSIKCIRWNLSLSPLSLLRTDMSANLISCTSSFCQLGIRLKFKGQNSTNFGAVGTCLTSSSLGPE